MSDTTILKIYHRYLETAINNPSIRKKEAWALYQTWKEVDNKIKGEQKNESV